MVPIYVFSIVMLSFTSASEDVKLVRGVELSRQPFYLPNKDFTCLDGSLTIPFSSVNDDYCDCADGTDEPGTAACPEGRYYCFNLGYKSKYLQSSRVNDGICDCCDGSDEYDSSVACFNECEKYGIEDAAMRKEEMAESIEGASIRNDYIQSGKEKNAEKSARIETINSLLEQRRAELEAAKAIKEAAEKPETESKDKHQKVWDELQATKKEEEDRVERNDAFDILDIDKDGWLSIAELLSHPHLDSDQSENDAKDLLSGESMVDREGMVNVWKSIKPKYLKDGRPDPATFDESNIDEKAVPPPVPSTDLTEDKKKGEELDMAKVMSDINKAKQQVTDEKEKERIETEMKKIYEDNEDEEEKDYEDKDSYKSAENYVSGEDDKDDDKEDEDEDDGDDGREDQDDHDERDVKSKDEVPEFDEETKELIKVADEARLSFEGSEKAVKDLEKEKKDAEEYLQLDFGPEQEFSALKGECYEYTDREYVYKLCPFDKVTQRNKDGGSETELGSKMSWSGGEGNHFSSMKYDGGQTCWNGPARSTNVRLMCGKENQVTSVTEPSRCEYEMWFKTPALCNQQAGHDEL